MVEGAEFAKDDFRKGKVAIADKVLAEGLPALVANLVELFLIEHIGVQGTEAQIDHTGMGTVTDHQSGNVLE